MDASLPLSWREEFERVARVKRDDLRRKDEALLSDVRDRMEREKLKREEDERDFDSVIAAVELVMATSQEIADFRVNLDEYDAATVEALMANSEALAAVRARIDEMLMQACVLPDGRRVFKTLDGTQVFDEYGQVVSIEVIDPDAIDDELPRWEVFDGANDEHARITAEREELIDYQARLDDARERLDDDEITRNELDEIKADLDEAMPVSVRATLEPDAPRPAEHVQPTTVAALPDDMDNLMRQTGLGPGLAGP
jgi:DNA repair exonuclease SbcCD ATPase subunit